MSTKPETQFISSVNRHLPRDVYRMHTNNPYIGGIPDEYYENKKILWVEYKFDRKLPPIVVLSNEKYYLTKLQQDWLRRCRVNGHQTAVILGWPDGGYVFVGDAWEEPIARDTLIERTCSRAEIARWISWKVGLDSSIVHRLGNCERFV